MILVIAEQREGVLSNSSWEVVSAAQELAESKDGPVKVAVIGSHIGSVGEELARAKVAEVLVVDDPALESYTADGFVEAVTQLVQTESPELVCFSHSYQTRDFAPRVATRHHRCLVTDCVGLKVDQENVVLSRPMFQGKFLADITMPLSPPNFASFQVGARQADSVIRGEANSPIRHVEVSINASMIRQSPEAPFQEAKQAVDLTQAERIVAVGRGIKGEEHLPIVQELVRLLEAELASSRPICDAGWLPMDRQVGSSGQTVTPRLYLALGISGAIQHLVGMKGARTIVAINKDKDAPIYEVADYGIVGDLFELVPALIAVLGE
tara:strand:+ start:7444 stop:8415 length:972 start_codon:yes stop_codon:yes gene_type:complete